MFYGASSFNQDLCKWWNKESGSASTNNFCTGAFCGENCISFYPSTAPSNVPTEAPSIAATNVACLKVHHYSGKIFAIMMIIFSLL